MQRYLGRLSLLLTSIVVFGVFGLPTPANATLYAPGATLDPACAPTDLNCGVATSTVASGTANQIPYYATNGSALSATSSVTILQNGNVGIGTTTPTAPFTLDSNSTTGTVLRISNSSPGGRVWDFLETGSSNSGGAGRLDFFDKTAGIARLSLAANGTIGIGTTSPSSEFAIQASAGMNYPSDLLFSIGSSTASGTSTLFTIDNAGNVGINAGLINALQSIDGFVNTNNNAFAEYGISNMTSSTTMPESGTSIAHVVQTSVNMNTTGTASGAEVAEQDTAMATGPGNTVNGGHIVGVKGLAFDNLGSTLSKAVGTEGAIQQYSLSGTISDAEGVQAYMQGNIGTITDWYGFSSQLGSNTGTIGQWADFYSPVITHTGITTAYSLLNQDPNKTISTLGTIGIGTTTPAAKLDIDIGPSGQVIPPSLANGVLIETNGSSVSSDLFETLSVAGPGLVVTNGGTVGIGSSTPTNNLSVTGTGQIAVFGGTAANDYIGVSAGVTASDNTRAEFGYNATSGNAVVQGNVAKGIEFDSSATFGSGQLAVITSGGNFGIGTTTPYAHLEVWGPDSAASTTAFSVVNNASSTAFAVYDNGNATYQGSIFQSSDQRLKTNVTPLDASTSLADIEGLTPVSYNRIDQPDTGTNLGFIAQAVQTIFPELVTVTSPTALTPGGTLTLNYVGLIAPMVKAIQVLAAEVNGFAQSITTVVLNATTVNATSLNGNQLCLGSTCVTETQLKAVLQASGQQGGSQSSSITITDTPPSPGDTANSTTTTDLDDSITGTTTPINEIPISTTTASLGSTTAPTDTEPITIPITTPLDSVSASSTPATNS